MRSCIWLVQGLPMKMKAIQGPFQQPSSKSSKSQHAGETCSREYFLYYYSLEILAASKLLNSVISALFIYFLISGGKTCLLFFNYNFQSNATENVSGSEGLFTHGFTSSLLCSISESSCFICISLVSYFFNSGGLV